MIYELLSMSKLEEDYINCIHDIINHEKVREMENYVQHGHISCLVHCIYVSYVSYLICKKYHLDYKAAARGALLHDFFLYDWHVDKCYKGLHAFSHPKIALKNARKYFKLNGKEKEIIQKHMWPLTINLPHYRETYIVTMADKYCACMEWAHVYTKRREKAFKKLLQYTT